MHHAPSVIYPVGRSSMGGWIALAAWTAGAVACGTWVAAGAQGWRAGLAVAAVLAGGAWAGVSWWRQPAGTLAWDGGNWAWQDGVGRLPHAGQVVPALDLQHWLLVRWQAADTGPAGGHPRPAARWFWLERRHGPARWLALRRAVYSRAAPGAMSGAEPPSA